MIGVAVLLVALTLAFGTVSVEAGSKKVTWNFHTLFGKGTTAIEEWHRPAIEEIKKATGGEFECVIFERSSLGYAGPDIWDVVGKGLVPVAEMWGPHVAGRYPWIVALELPFIFDITNLKLIEYLINSMWEDFAQPLAKDNMVLLSLQLHSAGRCFIVNKSLNPDPKTILKGMKIRVSGPIPRWGVETLGGIPVMLDFAEIYEAGQRGIVDGIDIIMTNAVFLHKYNEVFKKILLKDKKNLTLLQFSSTTGMVVANKGKFEGLPVEWQKIIKDSWKKAGIHNTRGMLREVDQTLRAAEKYGMIYVEVPHGTEDYLKSQAAPFWDKWREKAGPYGNQMLDEGLKRIKAFK